MPVVEALQRWSVEKSKGRRSVGVTLSAAETSQRRTYAFTLF